MIDDRTFRNAMGKFATGITVVTTEYEHEIYGMTVNAFMSVSLDPKLIAVSIGEQASMYHLIEKAGKFGVSILTENQKHLSMIYANQIEAQEEKSYSYLAGIPVIDQSLATIACKVKDVVKAGDHLIYIGEVMDLFVNEGKPLLYFNGDYKKLDNS